GLGVADLRHRRRVRAAAAHAGGAAALSHARLSVDPAGVRRGNDGGPGGDPVAFAGRRRSVAVDRARDQPGWLPGVRAVAASLSTHDASFVSGTLPPLSTATVVRASVRSLPAISAATPAAPPGSTTSLASDASARVAA